MEIRAGCSHAEAWARQCTVLKHTTLQRCAWPSPSFRMGTPTPNPLFDTLLGMISSSLSSTKGGVHMGTMNRRTCLALLGLGALVGGVAASARATVPGDHTRKETPNAISTIGADKLVQTRPITSMNDLLVAKAPGVEVLPGNITGAGARVRIRGTSSLSLNNEPIYIIDGV